MALLGLSALAAMGTGLVAALAWADDIQNTVDAPAKVMPLQAGGPNGTTRLYVVPRNGDGKNGCNLTGSTTLTVSVASSNPAVATVSGPNGASPSEVTFTSCVTESTGPVLTVTPHSAGTATISLTEIENTTGGSFNLAPATFTVNVSPPPNTPPEVSVAGVTGGTSYAKGFVPTATCQVTDAEDGNSSFPATLSAVSGPYASDGIGEQTASCSYTDAGGLTATASETYGIVDPSPPTIGRTLNPASPDGANGWYRSDVSLTWNVSDTDSPNSLQKTGCVDQNITSDQGATTYSCSASSAGGSSGPVDVTIKRDATAPTIIGSATPPANANGWNKTNVTVSFSCADNLSGVASCGPDQTLSTEGASHSASGTAVDNAGNSAQATVSGIKIDKTPPTVTCQAPAPAFLLGQAGAQVSATVGDLLSSAAASSVYGTADTSSVGTKTVSVTGYDLAGNSKSESCGYSVGYSFVGFDRPVDNGGVMNVAKAGQAIPLKWRLLDADNNPVTNLASAGITVASLSCSLGTTVDNLEEYAAGASGLQNLGNGYYQINWKSPTTYANSCKELRLNLGEGSPRTANFKFTK